MEYVQTHTTNKQGLQVSVNQEPTDISWWIRTMHAGLGENGNKIPLELYITWLSRWAWWGFKVTDVGIGHTARLRDIPAYIFSSKDTTLLFQRKVFLFDKSIHFNNTISKTLLKSNFSWWMFRHLHRHCCYFLLTLLNRRMAEYTSQPYLLIINIFGMIKNFGTVVQQFSCGKYPE